MSKHLRKLYLVSRIAFSSVQSFSHVQLFATAWTAARQAALSISSSWSLLKFVSIELVMPSNHLILSRPLLMPSIFPASGSLQMSPFFTSVVVAKSLQLCPTLCDPIDGSPPGFPIPGILQARTLEWVAISFSNA